MNAPLDWGFHCGRWIFRRTGRILASGILVVLAACSDHSQELDERVTQLQKELDRTQTELQATKQSLDATNEKLTQLKTNSGEAATVSKRVPVTPTMLPSRETLEASYTAAAKTLKKQIQVELKDFTLDTCTLHKVQIPSKEYPVESTISLSLRSQNDRAIQLDVPAKANPAGRWVFPEVGEIVRQIEEVGRSTATAKPPVENVVSASRSASQQQRPAIGSVGLPADRTVVIRWPASGGSPAQRNQTNAPSNVEPPARVTEQTSASGAKGLPADRTVVIQWPDSSSSSAPINRANGPKGSPPSPTGQNPKNIPADRDVLTQF
jgi:Skp family chaperone for outer membrane proteins